MIYNLIPERKMHETQGRRIILVGGGELMVSVTGFRIAEDVLHQSLRIFCNMKRVPTIRQCELQLDCNAVPPEQSSIAADSIVPKVKSFTFPIIDGTPQRFAVYST